MKIKKMTATFGKLKNARLELEDGLNIINAPNEYGKSTWCAFIKAMLYGIDSSERDKTDYLSAKTRFRPWNGDAMSGTMEIEHEGRSITIQRANKGVQQMKNFLAAYTGTANFITDLSGDNAGEELTGVSERIFERTAFIRRPDIRVSQTADLEKRISSLVSSGDERISFTETETRLKKWQNKLRHNRTGSIPALESELKENEAKLSELENANDETTDLRAGIERLTRQRELLQKDLETHDKLDRRNAARRVSEARAKARSAEERVERITAELMRNGRIITREDVNAIREAASAVEPLRKVCDAAEKNAWRTEKELSDISGRKKASLFSELGETETETYVNRAEELEKALEKEERRKRPEWITTAMLVCAAVCVLVCSGLLHGFFELINFSYAFIFGFFWPGICAGVLIAAVGLFIKFKPGKKKPLKEELEAIYDRFGVTSLDKLRGAFQTYSQICREEETARAARDGARQSYADAARAAQEAGDKAVAGIASIMPEVTSAESVMEAIRRIEELLDMLTKAEFDKLSSQSVYETLVADFDGNEEDENIFLQMPLRNREDTIAAINRADDQLARLTGEYNMAVGRQKTLGDPVVLESKIAELRDTIAEQTKNYEAISLAQTVMNDANMELQTRFSPLVSKRAGEIMAFLTEGRYEKLVFDRGFSAGARAADDAVNRPVLALSDGTSDEIYLALRLAMCDLILDGDSPCPIILDDALANFDDARCERALRLLMEMAQTRQIILFSCHKRESEMLKDSGVNIISC